MKTITRTLSVLLILAMLLSTLTALSFAAQRNTGTRHELCTALSSQANSYYSKNDFTYDDYAAFEGGNESCLDTVNSELFKELHDLMADTMTSSISYSSLTSYWKDTDREAGTNDATLFYSDFTSGSYNREHVWPKSRASFHQQDGGCDIHHLRPTNSSVNSNRSNYTMGNVKEHSASYSTYSNGGNIVLWYNGSYTLNGCTGLVEVNDNIKGDVARIFLYVYVRWEEANLFENDPTPKQASNDSGGNNGLKVIESLETLLEWCENDPVDTWEMSRNDACESIQGNRNVFIDYPEFAWLLFDQEMPTDMPTPSGMAQDSLQYTITANANNDAYGTVTLDGKTVTATPSTGYEIEGYTLTPSDAATVTRNGNTFKLSKVTADCNLTVNFKARVAATINYIVPEGITANGVTSAYVGDTVSLAYVTGAPTNTTHDYTFLGWSTASVQDTTSKPSVKAAGSDYVLTGPEMTFYATFSYTENGQTHYLTNLCKHESIHEETVEPTCDKAGATNTVCDSCGAVIESTPIAKLGHEYEMTTIAPTCDTKGYDRYVCSRCGDNYKKNYTNALGHIDENNDGLCDRCGTEVEGGTVPPTPPAENCPCEQFSDVSEKAWYHDAVVFAVENGLMNGVGDNQFDPEGSVTRAMLVTILYRSLNEPSVDGMENPFSDVKDGKWYTNAIIWAADNKIVNGTSETTYEPDASITREQIAAILYRFAVMSYEFEVDGELSFSDADDVSAYAVEAVTWATANGIINGMPDGTLAPAATATRAQLATMLMRFIDWCQAQPPIIIY